MLRLNFRTAMNNNKPTGSLCSPEHYEAARKIAGEGIVLLKNDNNCLPFTSNMKIGGLGAGQDVNFQFGGGGSGWVHAGDANRIHPKQGFVRLLQGR